MAQSARHAEICSSLASRPLAGALNGPRLRAITGQGHGSIAPGLGLYSSTQYNKYVIQLPSKCYALPHCQAAVRRTPPPRRGRLNAGHQVAGRSLRMGRFGVRVGRG